MAHACIKIEHWAHSVTIHRALEDAGVEFIPKESTEPVFLYNRGSNFTLPVAPAAVVCYEARHAKSQR